MRSEVEGPAVVLVFAFAFLSVIPVRESALLFLELAAT
jgi:hypothetical protein